MTPWHEPRLGLGTCTRHQPFATPASKQNNRTSQSHCRPAAREPAANQRPPAFALVIRPATWAHGHLQRPAGCRQPVGLTLRAGAVVLQIQVEGAVLLRQLGAGGSASTLIGPPLLRCGPLEGLTARDIPILAASRSSTSPEVDELCCRAGPQLRPRPPGVTHIRYRVVKGGDGHPGQAAGLRSLGQGR